MNIRPSEARTKTAIGAFADIPLIAHCAVSV
jgi:hypothetical protein